MTQISRYSIKLTTSLILEFLPCSAISSSVTHRSFHLSTFFRSFSHSWISIRPQCSLPISFFFSSSKWSFCNSVSSSCSQISVDLLHLPDDLLLEDRQDGFIVTNLLEHDTAVKLVAHFLKVEPAHTNAHKKTRARLFQRQKVTKMVPLKCDIHQMFSPVMALFGKQLLELAQSHHPAFDWCSVRDWLSTKVVSDRHVLTHLALTRLVPEREQDPCQNT